MLQRQVELPQTTMMLLLRVIDILPRIMFYHRVVWSRLKNDHPCSSAVHVIFDIVFETR